MPTRHAKQPFSASNYQPPAPGAHSPGQPMVAGAAAGHRGWPVGRWFWEGGVRCGTDFFGGPPTRTRLTARGRARRRQKRKRAEDQRGVSTSLGRGRENGWCRCSVDAGRSCKRWPRRCVDARRVVARAGSLVQGGPLHFPPRRGTDRGIEMRGKSTTVDNLHDPKGRVRISGALARELKITEACRGATRESVEHLSCDVSNGGVPRGPMGRRSALRDRGVSSTSACSCASSLSRLSPCRHTTPRCPLFFPRHARPFATSTRCQS